MEDCFFTNPSPSHVFVFLLGHQSESGVVRGVVCLWGSSHAHDTDGVPATARALDACPP